MSKAILPWVGYTEEMLLRSAFSLAASCYIVATLVLLPFWLRTLRMPLAEWWVVFLAAEVVALTALIAPSLWWLLGRTTGHTGHAISSRFVTLVALVIVPIFGFFVIPIGCWTSLPNPVGGIVGWSIFTLSAIALLLFLTYARYKSRKGL